MNPRCFQIRAEDNVATLIDDAQGGTVELLGVAADKSDIALVAVGQIAAGHKIAVKEIAAGEAVMKFGVRIGHATQRIARGDWVHLHNLASDLDVRSGTLDLHSGAPTDTRYE